MGSKSVYLPRRCVACAAFVATDKTGQRDTANLTDVLPISAIETAGTAVMWEKITAIETKQEGRKYNFLWASTMYKPIWVWNWREYLPQTLGITLLCGREASDAT